MANFLYIPRNGGDCRRYDTEQLRTTIGSQAPEFETFLVSSLPGDFTELPGGIFVRLGSEFIGPTPVAPAP